jgi:hypothetical protein
MPMLVFDIEISGEWESSKKVRALCKNVDLDASEISKEDHH